MKRSLTLILITVITVYTLSSCSFSEFNEKEFLPERVFTVHMTAEKDTKKFEADIKCSTYEEMEIVFTSPEELSGFSVTTTADGYTVNAFGITDNLADEEIEDGSIINILTKTLKTAVFTNHGRFTQTENGYSANFVTDNVPVNVVFSNNGIIRSFKAESIGFSAQFQ